MEINIFFFQTIFSLKKLFSVRWQFPERSSQWITKTYLEIVMNVLISRLENHIKSRFKWGKEASTQEIQVITASLETHLFYPFI